MKRPWQTPGVSCSLWLLSCPAGRGETEEEGFLFFFTHETVKEPPAAFREALVHIKDWEHCGLICENFFGLRHLISAYRKACTPLFNSLTRKAELFPQLTVWDLAHERLHAAQLLTRANQSDLIKYLFFFFLTVKALRSCVCVKCLFRTEQSYHEQDCFLSVMMSNVIYSFSAEPPQTVDHNDHINPASVYRWLQFRQKNRQKTPKFKGKHIIWSWVCWCWRKLLHST